MYFILHEVGGKQCFVENEVATMKYSGYQSSGNTYNYGYSNPDVIVNGYNSYHYSQVVGGNTKYWYLPLPPVFCAAC